MAGPAALAAVLGEGWDARRDRLDATGAVVAVTDRERTLAVVALGAADRSGAPMTAGTRFQIGSVSKSFAAILALQEERAGRLDLAAPVTRFLPWFEVPSRFGPIAVHHLLSHTSGLATGTEFTGEAHAALLALRETEVGFAPGERFLYSNDAYKAVGLILEGVTGRRYPDLLRERILAPLGMTSSDPEITLPARAGSAPGHRRALDDRPDHPGQPLVEAPWVPSWTADGSILSTGEDLCAYARMLLGRGSAPDGTAVLPEPAFARMLEPRATDPDEPDAPYGFGIRTTRVEGRLHAGHTGSMIGHVARLSLDLDAGVGAVVLLNGASGRDLAARDDLARAALAGARALAEGREPPAVPAPPRPDAVPDAPAHAGTYRAADGRALVLAARGDRLLLVQGGREVALEPARGDRFVVPHPDLDRFPLSVRRDPEGRVVEAIHGPDVYRREGLPPLRPVPPDPAWEALAGDYRSTNPWAPAFSVVLREGRPVMIAPWLERSEEPLEPLAGDRFRVGPAWSPDRLRFEDVVEGRPRRAVYDGAPWFRTA